MPPELILCIPGPWKDRTDLTVRIINTEPKGRYVFLGALIADLEAKDHATLEFCPTDANVPRAFEIAGQGKLPKEILARLRDHTSVVYLHFPLNFSEQRERMLKFTRVLREVGGIAVKVESAGVAHTWERWFALLSGASFDHYTAFVVLIGDKDYYYSCGMHHFGLPECEVPRELPVREAAELMNRFNFWRIAEQPKILTRHTFSVAPAAPRFRLSLEQDTRHEAEDLFLFRNPHGLWRLSIA